jgi:CheY-like chemotaxis protein
MMPGMDGIETTIAIRSFNKQIPIIALTANVVFGIRDTFLQQGFNDMLAKPIDILKLDEILSNWIPKEKREMGNWNSPDSISSDFPLPVISGVDMQQGIATTGGKIDSYRKVLILFRKDVLERLPLLQTAVEAESLPAFITAVHAIKSASANIGALETSKKSAELENAGKVRDLDFIQEKLPDYSEDLKELADNIQTALELWEMNSSETSCENQQLYSQLLDELEQALISNKASSDILDILDNFDKISLDSNVREILDEASSFVLMSEFDDAIKLVKSLREGK